MKLAVILLGCLILFTGCSKHVQLRVDDLARQQSVHVKTNSGVKVSGIVAQIDDNSIVISDQQKQNRRIKKTDIAEVSGPKPVRDPAGKIISEAEISQHQKAKNTWLYATGGTLLSMGASFFASSMISRGADKETDDPITFSGTAAGTCIGAYFFTRAGMNKDRQHAINEIMAARSAAAASESSSEEQHQKQILDEIEKLKFDRKKQDAEIEELKKKIEQDKKEKP
jgi:hypothetical protein